MPKIGGGVPHAVPEGIGVYIRRLSEKTHGSPAEAAARARRFGLRFVAIMATWQDLKDKRIRQLTPNLKRDLLKRYADAFKAEGIDVWIWCYPWGGAEDAMVESMERATAQIDGGCSGWLLDPELGYKWHSAVSALDATMRGQPEAIRGVHAHGSEATRKSQAAYLMQLCDQVMAPHMGIGVTSYGIPRYHPNFPWQEFLRHKRVTWLSPQLYTATPEQIDRGVRQWHLHTGYLAPTLPSVPAYGRKSGAALHEHLSHFVSAAEVLDGFVFWSWRQLSGRKGSAGPGRSEWDIVARWAEWCARGACFLPA